MDEVKQNLWAAVLQILLHQGKDIEEALEAANKTVTAYNTLFTH